MTRYPAISLALALAVFAAGLSACSDTTRDQSSAPKLTTATTLMLSMSDIPVRYVTSGTVTSDHRVVISSRVSGYIREMKVREGDKVQEGQVLVRVDPVDAKQALIQARADMADAQSDLRRYNELLKAGAVTDQQAARVRLRFKVAKSQVEQARNQLSYAEVRSPVAGVVVEKRLAQGDLAAPGIAILTLEDPTSLLVDTYVSEKFVGGIREGSAVDIDVPAAHQTYNGIVRQVVRAADPVSHQFLVKSALPAAEAVHPGMYAQTGFHVGNRKALLIPAAAVIARSGLHGVYVLDDKGIAHYRQVRLGNTMTEQPAAQVEVLAGLHDGDVIALQGQPALQSGYRVTSRADDHEAVH